MKITAKGQVTIPQELREEFGLLPHPEVEFVREGRGGVRLRKSPRAGTRGAEHVAALRGKWRGKLGTDEVMAMTRGESCARWSTAMCSSTRRAKTPAGSSGPRRRSLAGPERAIAGGRFVCGHPAGTLTDAGKGLTFELW